MNAKTVLEWASRTEAALQTESPGPGAYTLQESTYTKTPKYSIGRSERFDPMVQTHMGPGFYSTSSPSNSKGFAVDKTSRPPISGRPNHSPGPGRYDQKLPSSGPSFSLGGRLPIKTSSKSKLNPMNQTQPGPGEYDFPSAAKKSCTFAREIYTSHKYGPGPGVYTPEKPKNITGCKFGQSSRNLENTKTKSKSPGPGSYNLSNIAHKKACSIGGKLYSEVYESGPGPGTYEWLPKDTHMYPRMGLSPRHLFKTPPDVPGPGTYDNNDPRYERNARVNGRSSKKSIEFIQKGYTISGRNEQKDKETAPGPGNYYQEFKRARGNRFSVSIRITKGYEKSEEPGPGSYSVKAPISKTFTFSNSLRTQRAHNGVPGPGKYDKGNEFGKLPNHSVSPSKAYNFL